MVEFQEGLSLHDQCSLVKVGVRNGTHLEEKVDGIWHLQANHDVQDHHPYQA